MKPVILLQQGYRDAAGVDHRITLRVSRFGIDCGVGMPADVVIAHGYEVIHESRHTVREGETSFPPSVKTTNATTVFEALDVFADALPKKGDNAK